MICVVGVRFKLAGKVYYFDPADLAITRGSKVIVETVRGVEYGEVVVGPRDVEDEQVVQPLKRVIRIGTERDAEIAADNKRKEKDAFAIALKKIEAHHLDMYLVDVEYTFDGSKIIFYFTAEGRIDFRELVRDLAGVFRTRIEMRQIGVRDEAKLLGGIGPCGRVLCCTSFLGDFAPVSIRMAKDQNLSLNPSKISGLCGRLMCCLRYEQETYEAAKKDPTLAPGYVPPLSDPEGPAFEGWEEERVTPAIGVRDRTESGFSARIAQAAVAERTEVRREKRRPTAVSSTADRGGDRRPGKPPGERQVERQTSGDQPPQAKQRPNQERLQPETAGSREGRSPGQPGKRREGRPADERRGRGDQAAQPRAEQQMPTSERGGQNLSVQAGGERSAGSFKNRRRRRRGPRPGGGEPPADPA